MSSEAVTVWLVCSSSKLCAKVSEIFARLPVGAWNVRATSASISLSEIRADDVVMVDLELEFAPSPASATTPSTWETMSSNGKPLGGLTWLHRAVDENCAATLIALAQEDGDLRDGTPWNVAAMEAGATDFLNVATLTPELLERVLHYARDRAKVSAALARRDAIRRAVGYAAQRFLSQTQWQNSIGDVVERLGRAAQVSRVFVYRFGQNASHDASHVEHFSHENFSKNEPYPLTPSATTESQEPAVLHLEHAWAAPGGPPIEFSQVQRFDMNQGEFARYAPLMSSGETLQFQTRDFPNPEHDYLVQLGILSWVVVPIMASGAFWGVLGFTEMRSARTWNRFELDALRMAGDLLGAAIEHGRVEAERAHAEEAWRQSTRFNEEVISCANEGIFVHDTQLRYVLWNPYMERLTGLSAPQVLGKRTEDIFHCSGHISLDDLMQRVLEGQSEHTGEIFFTVESTGRNGWISCLFEPHRNAHGDIIGLIGVVRDESERHLSEERLRSSEEKFRALIENGQDIICVLGEAGEITYGSPSLKRVLGYAPEEIVGSSLHRLMHEDDVQDVREHLSNLQKTPGLTDAFEMRLRHRDGDWRTFEATGANLIDNSAVGGIVINARDITQRKRAEEALIRAAMHDRLTSLPNRALFMDRVRLRIERARRAQHSLFAVLFLDFDRFKVINDSLGHMAGDQMLVAVARRLENCLRPGDTVARLGGDEFAILLEDISGTSDAVFVAERMQKEMRRPFTLQREDGSGASSNHEIFTAASIGIAIAGTPPRATFYDRPEDLLRDADIAMYRAKERGRARHEIFNAAMHEDAMTRLQMETDLRASIERGDFAVHYQPIIALDSGLLTGFEALVRWHHPTRGLVAPREFLGVAEETGLIAPLGWWVLRQSCLQLRQWMDEMQWEDQGELALHQLTMSVNLSGRQFMHTDLFEHVQSALNEANLLPQNLRLEITESVLMTNPEATGKQMQELRKLGVQLGIDDFGTGYSNLSYLHKFPVDSLKIDRSFVSQLKEDHNDGIVKTIIGLAEQLNLEVVAEGVETNAQMEQLQALHCRLAQGYFFSRPLDDQAATEFLSLQPMGPQKPILDY